MIINDVELFKIALYREFVRNGHIDTSTPFWKNPWFIGGVAGALTGPFAFMGLVGTLGFGAGGIASGSFAAWFMSLYGGAVSSGSVCAILQSIGAAGLGATGIFATGSAGAAAGAAFANNTTAPGTEVINQEFYEKNKLSESEERSLENFLKIEQSDNNTIIFNFKKSILEKKFIDTLLEVLIVIIPLVNSKIFVFKYDKFGNNFTLSDYILDKLRENYDNLYVSEGIKLDLSNFDFKDEKLKNLISEWKCKNNKE